MAKKFKKPVKYDYDLVVIGAGASGSVGANDAASRGKKVLVIENNTIGGECPSVTCVPTKALMESVKTFRNAETAMHNGVTIESYSLSRDKAQHWVKKAINTATYDSREGFSDPNITLIKGYATFVNPWQISVNSKRITGKRILIACGASPRIPAIHGLEQVGYLTYKDLSLSQEYPESVCFVGGGAVAYEYSQILSAFGVKVHIIEHSSHILPNMDQEAGDIASDILAKLGVSIHNSASPAEVGISENGNKYIIYTRLGRKYRLVINEIIISSSKTPNLDIAPENAGIKYDSWGIKVNSLQQTNKKHIYSAGEVCGHNFTATGAIKETRVAVHNMFGHKKAHTNHAYTPVVLYGIPEIATVGTNEKAMKMTGKIYQTAIAPIGILGKSVTSQYNNGFVKLIANHKGVVIGATVVSPNASEIINLLSFAVKNHSRACDLAESSYTMPSWSEAVRIAATKIYCI